MRRLTTFPYRKFRWHVIALIGLGVVCIVHSYRTKIEVVDVASRSDVDLIVEEIQRIDKGYVISGLNEILHVGSAHRINRIKLKGKTILFGRHGDQPTRIEAITAHVWKNGSSDFEVFLCRWDDSGKPIVTALEN